MVLGAPTNVFCDQTQDSGGWTLVMRGSTNESGSSSCNATGNWGPVWGHANTYAAANATEGTFAGSTFKFSDAIINAIGGMYRVKTQGTYNWTRFHAASCVYNHMGQPASGDACARSCSDTTLTACTPGTQGGYGYGLNGGTGTPGHGYGQGYYNTNTPNYYAYHA